jgi:hypothetical protein
MEKNFIITVTDVNESPVVKSPIDDLTIIHSPTFTYIISDSTFYDSDVDDKLIYSASLTNGDLLPNWLSFNSSTRTFSGSLNNICTLIDTIRVQVTDKAGLSAYDDFILTVNNIPSTPVITLNNNILQSSETGGNQWYLNNNILSDATNSTMVPVSQGDYYVVVTMNGCSSEPSNTIEFVPTNIYETTGCNNGISVCPNPTSDILKISINQKFDSDYSIEVFNNVGLLLQTLKKNKSESNIKLDLSSFPAGVYILRICNITIYYQTIIIKR